LPNKENSGQATHKPSQLIPIYVLFSDGHSLGLLMTVRVLTAGSATALWGPANNPVAF